MILKFSSRFRPSGPSARTPQQTNRATVFECKLDGHSRRSTAPAGCGFRLDHPNTATSIPQLSESEPTPSIIASAYAPGLAFLLFFVDSTSGTWTMVLVPNLRPSPQRIHLTSSQRRSPRALGSPHSAISLRAWSCERPICSKSTRQCFQRP
ncbi:hypothetical protein C2E23DRAFT_197751 [Lenzites betulinus]|nr:hypothetical protein C2E23DRAFT_197751 [Lenzites betulinus]